MRILIDRYIKIYMFMHIQNIFLVIYSLQKKTSQGSNIENMFPRLVVTLGLIM